jgi:alcohol-forming fatty acyl-CoA reductase
MLVYFCAVLVEKILRVQPAVRRIYLLVRAADEPSAQQRVQQEVTGTELFSLLRDKYGEEGFDLFIRDKIVPLAGDITNQDLGLEPTTLDGMAKEMDVIVNVAATTNFYERSLFCRIWNGKKNKNSFVLSCMRMRVNIIIADMMSRWT